VAAYFTFHLLPVMGIQYPRQPIGWNMKKDRSPRAGRDFEGIETTAGIATTKVRPDKSLGANHMRSRVASGDPDALQQVLGGR
jgi:hypothetical protein